MIKILAAGISREGKLPAAIFFLLLYTACGLEYSRSSILVNNNTEYTISGIYIAEEPETEEDIAWGENRIDAPVSSGRSVLIEDLAKDFLKIKVVFQEFDDFHNIQTVDLRFTTKLVYNVSLPE